MSIRISPMTDTVQHNCTKEIDDKCRKDNHLEIQIRMLLFFINFIEPIYKQQKFLPFLSHTLCISLRCR
jgi:hypothetical protein